jgi:arylesterase/paraoxonase
MKTLLKSLMFLLGSVVLLIGAGTLWFLNRGGAFRELKPHFAGICEALELPGSGEDIQVDRARGYAYVSLLDRQRAMKGEAVEGTIARIDLNASPLVAVSAIDKVPAGFHPHGLSLFIEPDGTRHIFVINHPARRGEEPEAVEHFVEAAPGNFTHAETFRDPRLTSPNDLVAVGPHQFFVANDKPDGGALRALLQQLGYGSSPLVFFDGANARTVAADIASGGGINVSPDYKRLYVSETAGRRIRVFQRRNDRGSVNEMARVPLETAPDNIDVAEDGSLWVTGHANVLALIRHFISGHPAPSQTWRVELDDNGTAKDISERYLDDGTNISAGSVGATYRQMLLVGSITAKRIMICRADPVSPQ